MTLIAESVPEDVPLPSIGSLRRVALPEILKRVVSNELSGTLEARAGGVVRTLFFDRGFLVFTASTAKQDRLGKRILRAGKLTEEQIERAARHMATKNLRIGQAIVAAGLLSEEELGQELVQQARRIAKSIFGLKIGLYRFTETKCPIPMEFRLSLSMYRLQLEGIREMSNKKLIVASLPRPEQRVRAARNVPFSFEGLRFEPIELLVMEAAQKERPILEIVQRVSQGSDDVFRALYGLLCARILEGAGATAHAVAFKVQEETGRFLLSRTHDRGHTQAQNVRQEVLLEYERVQHASPAEVLHVPPDASSEEVRKAFEDLRSAWDRKQWEIDDEDFLSSKVDEIQRRLERAKNEILLTKAPEASKSRSGSDPRSAEVARLLREMKRRREVLNRSLEEASHEVSKASAQEASAKAAKQDDEIEVKRLLQEIKRRTRAMKRDLDRAKEEASRTPSATGAPTPVPTRLPAPAPAPAPLPAPASEPVPEAPGSGPKADVEALLRQAETRRVAGDPEGLISVYYELVGAAPDVAQYEVLLAEALAAHPVFERKAERHYRHAIMLDPQNARLHYLLGRHYQSMNLNERAIVEIRAALRIDGSLVEAKEALVAIGGDPGSP